MPVDSILPHIAYRDLEAAVAWLGKAFGFTEHYHYGEPISGAQMYLGRAFVMAHRGASPSTVGEGTQSLTIFVDDVDAHYAHAKAAGAKIVEEVHVTCYGERQYGVEDLEGHHWLFSKHAEDLSPDQWGATLVKAPAAEP